MKKFEHISSCYGSFFPAKPEQLDFLQNSLPDSVPARWVDLACGTGQQMEALTNRGLEVWGLDLEEKMVEKLKERVPALAARVVVADMRFADRELGPKLPGPAGAVYCIGNSLVQLTDMEDIRATLAACANLLAPGGAVVVQIVNFDRVLSGDLRMLPIIERQLPSGEVLKLERWYVQSESSGCLEFKTRLTSPAGTEERSHDLRALQRHELQSLLLDAGFSSLRWCGDYLGSPWQQESPATIVQGNRS